MVARTLTHVSGEVIIELGNMQPSQQMCSKARVGAPFSSRIHNPAA
jgi:hypothetical protein